MRYLHALIALFLLLLASCASQPHEVAKPKIDRLTPEELARIIPQPVAKLNLDDIVSMSQQGSTPQQIIARIQATDSMYDLTPSQSLALSAAGVDSKVLDYMHARRALAIQNNLADEINRREQQKQAEIAKLKNQNRVWQSRYFDPYCRFGRFSPYGFGGFGTRFGSRYGSGFGIGTGFGTPFGCW